MNKNIIVGMLLIFSFQAASAGPAARSGHAFDANIAEALKPDPRIEAVKGRPSSDMKFQSLLTEIGGDLNRLADAKAEYSTMKLSSEQIKNLNFGVEQSALSNALLNSINVKGKTVS